MIFLLRHGEVLIGEERRFIGWADVPLTEEGIRQATAWRGVFAGQNFEHIYCSDLSRAKQTAEIIGQGRMTPITAMPALREINMGVFEGVSINHFRECSPERWRQHEENILTFQPDHGESFANLLDRVIPAFEEIVQRTETDALVVAHAGVNRVILCHLLGIPLQNLFRIGQGYAGLNKIDCRQKPYQVIAVNIELPACDKHRV